MELVEGVPQLTMVRLDWASWREFHWEHENVDAMGPSGNRGLGDVKVRGLLEDGAECETTSLHAAALGGLHEMGWASEV